MPKKNVPKRQFIPRSIVRKKTAFSKNPSAKRGSDTTLEASWAEINKANEKSDLRGIQDFERFVNSWGGEAGQAYYLRLLRGRGWTRTGSDWVKDGISIGSTEGIESDPLSATAMRMVRRFSALTMFLQNESKINLPILKAAYDAGESYGEWAALETTAIGRPETSDQKQKEIGEAYDRFISASKIRGQLPTLKDLKGLGSFSDQELTKWKKMNRGKTSRDKRV